MIFIQHTSENFYTTNERESLKLKGSVSHQLSGWNVIDRLLELTNRIGRLVEATNKITINIHRQFGQFN